MSETPRIKCEKCKGMCKKLMGTGAGLLFKGSGFYETDYKTKKGGETKESAGKSDADAKPSKSETKSAGESGGKSDSKPSKSESSTKPSKSS